jgi:hypothetical protein
MAMSCRRLIGSVALVAVLSVSIGIAAFGSEMKYPDWESQWKNPNAGIQGNQWDTTKPIGLGQQAPLTPEYQAIFEASLKDQVTGGQGNSLGSACVLFGMPKLMSLAQPMEILIEPAVTYFVPTHDPTRRIYTDGRDWPADEPPTFQGTSIGRWIDEDGDGRYDTLEVETRNFIGPRVFESSGLPLHKDNQTIVKERLYLDRDNNDVLHDEITTIDHALTRPWTVLKSYVRDRHPVWLEYNCHQSNNHIVIGNDSYFLSADNKLMPVRKGQTPPDLRYFK